VIEYLFGDGKMLLKTYHCGRYNRNSNVCQLVTFSNSVAVLCLVDVEAGNE